MGQGLAKELRSPTPGTCLGWMAQKIMSSGKGEDSIDAVSQILGFDKLEKPVVVEIGPGAGYSMRKIFETLEPSRVYGIEISEAFRQILQKDSTLSPKIESGVLTLHGDDAKELKFIPDNSVDVIFAFNVIYFLTPLNIYLKETRRILKPGGTINFGVEEMAKKMDATIYNNTDWDKCLEEMKIAGFVDTEVKAERLKGPIAYIPIVGKAPLS